MWMGTPLAMCARALAGRARALRYKCRALRGARALLALSEIGVENLRMLINVRGASRRRWTSGNFARNLGVSLVCPQ